ncbi:L-2-hydroxyglutarate oxidase LhgO [Malaciobacter marinus]|jgi:L-2-hydroxyglutarate oxidase LhgO|uniref:L-2-hydroxyglutarate oxidase LhgO n=1 Tax=Malaciobacter marinus TaxID=505249 RepID=A0AB36ZWJ3_9BACT|nr:L-2-hydroxyglutarate oxidase [Malaciobacter marinus]PPK60959.1 L-2-hydroxyglutarate oxidase LhgO [Malaciobacter marinus]SKB43824.1 L-2-hydroxyglutarate oxidase LhgO [Malaciobacter marinus]
MYDYLIIGAGIIGLNIAKNLKERFPFSKILVIEKESEVGMHSSGRNSGVLHAGFYYTANSLKAKFTKEGNEALKKFVKQRGLKINECKKVVVATNDKELEGLEELKRRGDANSVELQWLDEQSLNKLYPNIKTYKKALLCPSTATVNPKEVTKEFAKVIQELKVELILDCKYISSSCNVVSTTKGDFQAMKVINCAGLYADTIAKDFGFSKDYVIIPFKGIYLKDKNNKSNLKTNIYPVPNLANPFLGVHYTLTVDNESKIGPTAIPAFWRENYKGFDNFKLKEFIQILYYESKLFISNAFGFRSLAFSEIKKYSLSHLKNLAMTLTNKKMKHEGFDSWSTPGIRAQLLNKNTLELVQDFVVESDENSIHVLNAVSPAFTSSIPFANWVVQEHILKQTNKK